MFKKDLRLNYDQLRKNLGQEILQQHSIQIANQLLNLSIWHLSNFHLFMSISARKEIDTQPIMTILQGKDKNIIVPKMDGDTLKHYLLTDNTQFSSNKWGIPEPDNGFLINEKKIDIVFVPLLAYDKMGNRVGYGKGYYDGFLKKCKDNVIKVGLSFFDPVALISDVADHDIKLNYCVTPNKIYSFSED